MDEMQENKSPEPPAPGKKKNSSDNWREQVVRLKNREQVVDLSVPDLRSIISKLTVDCFFPHYADKKPRGLWRQKRPDEWPMSLPFQDPHNKASGGNGKKIRKETLVDIIFFLLKTYKRREGQECSFLETPVQPTGYEDQTQDPPVVSPHINPHPTALSEALLQPSAEIGGGGVQQAGGAVAESLLQLDPLPETTSTAATWTPQEVEFHQKVAAASVRLCDTLRSSYRDEYLTHQVVELADKLQNNRVKGDKSLFRILHRLDYFAGLDFTVDETELEQFNMDLESLNAILSHSNLSESESAVKYLYDDGNVYLQLNSAPAAGVAPVAGVAPALPFPGQEPVLNDLVYLIDSTNGPIDSMDQLIESPDCVNLAKYPTYVMQQDDELAKDIPQKLGDNSSMYVQVSSSSPDHMEDSCMEHSGAPNPCLQTEEEAHNSPNDLPVGNVEHGIEYSQQVEDTVMSSTQETNNNSDGSDMSQENTNNSDRSNVSQMNNNNSDTVMSSAQEMNNNSDSVDVSQKYSAVKHMSTDSMKEHSEISTECSVQILHQLTDSSVRSWSRKAADQMSSTAAAIALSQRDLLVMSEGTCAMEQVEEDAYCDNQPPGAHHNHVMEEHSYCKFYPRGHEIPTYVVEECEEDSEDESGGRLMIVE